MSLSIFDHRDYRHYLLQALGDKSERKGLKSSAAKFMNCHTTLISQILHGQVVPNLEQSERLSRFLQHSDEETHFFLLLVQKERAGTKDLENYFQGQIDAVLKNRQIIKKRIGKTDTIGAEDESRYYSSWHYAAIHVALSVPDLTTPDEISRTLGIPLAQVKSVLEFLRKAGLAVSKDAVNYSIGPTHIHLGSESPQILNHHTHWRARAIQSLDRNNKSDFHYSSAVTLSATDARQVTEILLQTLKSMNNVIQNSKEEEIYGLSMDFFNLRT